MSTTLNAQHIHSKLSEDFDRGVFFERAVVVNRASSNDDNVVLSFNANDGSRDAIGLSPKDARLLAIALLRAADVVEGVYG